MDAQRLNNSREPDRQGGRGPEQLGKLLRRGRQGIRDSKGVKKVPSRMCGIYTMWDGDNKFEGIANWRRQQQVTAT